MGIILRWVRGVDPRVVIDGVDVTDRVSSVELLPLGIAVVHMYRPRQASDGVNPDFGSLPRQVVQQEYRVVNGATE